MKRKIIRVVVSFLALVPFVQPGLAVAAPQTLRFVATNGPVELKCEAGHCKAEFSSFCLQEKHGPPTKGTPYFAMHTRSIQVTASRSDGRQISLSPAMDFTMTASRGHVAVLLSIRPDVGGPFDEIDDQSAPPLPKARILERNGNWFGSEVSTKPVY